jgi:hypothetical protein
MPSGRKAARRLRYLYPPHRLWLVGTLKQLASDREPVLLQVGRQIADGHSVDARRTFVALHLRQCLLQVLTLDHYLPRRFRDRRAFETGFRRARFGLSGGDASGFTLCPGAQVQLDLILLPHGSHEIAALLAPSTVRAFAAARCRLLCPRLTSALRSGRLTTASVPNRDTTQTSRGKTDRLHRTPAGFTTPTLDDRGLRDQLLARPAG